MDYLRKKWYRSLIFVIPALVIYLIMVIIPIGQAIYYSLCDWNGISTPTFLGFENYITMFTNPDFGTVIKNTVISTILALLIQPTVALVFAFMIYRCAEKAQKVYRVLVFLPAVVAAASISLMFTLLFNSEIGPVNQILTSLGVQNPPNWLSDAKIVLYSVITPMIYQFIGYYVVILLAGMQSLPEDIFESAALDGANVVQVFWKIVVPTQAETIIMCCVLIIGGAMKAFEHSYIMTWGGPGVASSFLGVYMYNTTFQGGKFGMGSAISIVIMVLAVTFAILLKKFGRKFEY
ncbi:carbohydrate ABC transporter permease [Massiliimalia massiliensis]|uniref:carbohydrate ABC transporter permease n=1 Tax=Massiliimalia massiliensis TaxID=1852384 RepID=UPI000984E401|nr:sugar ABC transporter permease [Massiliimalia massiliensis]